MTSETKTWRLTIRMPSGESVIDLLVEAVAAEAKLQEAVATAPAPAPLRPVPGTQGNNGDVRITDPQRRYLFRLLAAQGVQGKDAEAHLKTYFKVANLRDVSKAAASEYINQLASDRKEAHGS